MNKIYTVKEFNILQTAKWNEDCANRKNNQSLPFLGSYLYSQKDGYVLKHNTGSHWFKTKKLAQEACNAQLEIKLTN